MTSDRRFFLLDSWDLSLRDVSGYSQAEPHGSRQLDELPRCPGCGRRVFPLATKYPFTIDFPGRRIGDLAFGIGGVLIVSERFMKTWRQNDLLGLIFSPGPVEFNAKRGAVIEPEPPLFYAAYPEPEFVCLAPEAGAEYGTTSHCAVCCSSEVMRLRRVLFAAGHELPDFFIASCLSGWLVVSGRAAALIDGRGFGNLQFVQSFQWTSDRRLLRKYASSTQITPSGAG